MTRAALTTVVALLLLAVAGTFAATGWYFDRETFDEGVVVSTMRSTVLGEDREVIVHPPESYLSHPDRRYPVIYVLDGSNQDIHTARSAALMARIGLMPEVLVVGVPNVSGPGRQRDYTPPFMVQDIDDAKSPMGRGDRFLEFMRTELIPDIERNYRADSTRMLLGHSRGGLLVAYSLMATPELFQARFAHSPALWRDHTVMAGKLTEYLAKGPVPDSVFYMSLGTEENQEMADAFDRVRSVLAAGAPPGLRWQADRTAGADHGKNGEWATPVGLRAFYRSWTGNQ